MPIPDYIEQRIIGWGTPIERDLITRLNELWGHDDDAEVQKVRNAIRNVFKHEDADLEIVNSVQDELPQERKRLYQPLVLAAVNASSQPIHYLTVLLALWQAGQIVGGNTPWMTSSREVTTLYHSGNIQRIGNGFYVR